MRKLDLTPFERELLERSANSDITRRRRGIIILTGLTAAILLVWAACLKQSWQFVLIVSLIYVVATVLEKIFYANAVLAYKSVIQKLKKRVEELQEKTDAS